MISVYAWSALVWIFLSVQAPAQGTLTKLVETRRIDLGTKYRLTATYEADSPVDAVWWMYVNGPLVIIPGSQAGPGEVSLNIEKEPFSHSLLCLSLGDRKSHYLDIYWSSDGHGDRTSHLDLLMSSVSPGTDNVYNPNDHLSVTVEVEHWRGNGSLKTDAKLWPSSLKYVNKTRQELESHESVPFVTTSSYSENNVTTNTVMFHVDDVINGYFVYKVQAYPVNTDTSPLTEVTEMFVLNVHEPSIRGPFPNGFVNADFSARNGRVSCSNPWNKHKCTLYCISYGNDLKSVDIYKVQNGSREKMETRTSPGTTFRKMIILPLDPTLDSNLGEYVCKATVADGDTKEDTVTVSI